MPELAQATIRFIQSLPRSALTQAIGWLAERPIPSPVRPVVLGGLARALRMDMAEAEHPIHQYGSFQELFCRRLANGARRCEPHDRVVVSPVDGVFVEGGSLEPPGAYRVKGRSYSTASLLGDPEAARRYLNGSYAVFYLSPRDYHRMHSPVQAAVVGYRWIRGDFWPVNELSRRLPDVYSDNERVVTYLEAAGGQVAMVKIAAFGVGYISLAYLGETAGHRLPRNQRPAQRVYEPDQRPRLVPGEEIAAFGLGSTVVLLFEPGRVQLLDERIGRRVKVGEEVGKQVIT
jgi:phosphatidylserine decarboxylase